MDGSQINVCHPGGLKRAIDTKLNLQDPLPYLTGTASAFTRFTSFVEAVQEEEEEFVWGAIVELEEEVKNIKGLVTTQAQERAEVMKGTNKNKEAVNKIISKREEKTVETHQSAYC